MAENLISLISGHVSTVMHALFSRKENNTHMDMKTKNIEVFEDTRGMERNCV